MRELTRQSKAKVNVSFIDTVNPRLILAAGEQEEPRMTRNTRIG
jgi:hypothetical protein